jgi:hypothetical protein
LRRALITFLSRGIHSEIFCQSAINRFTDLAMMPDLLETEMGKVTCSISYSEQPQWLPLYAQLFRHPPQKWQAAAVKICRKPNP